MSSISSRDGSPHHPAVNMTAVKMTTVTAIIPTRDRAPLVGRAIASVLGQTRPPDELLVVDDGSRDETEAVVRRFAGARYLRGAPPGESVGVSAARNHGLKRATGEWLAFLDSDDEWHPEKLEAQLAALAAAPEMRVCHTDEVWIRDGRRVNPRRRHRKHGGFIFRHCLPLCAMSPSSILIHRSDFERAGTFDETLPACEDYDLWLRICCRYPVLYLDRRLIVKYGGHEDQLSRTVEALDRYRIQALFKILESGILQGEDRAAAWATLEKKVRVYTAGAEKRGREAEAAECRERFAELQKGLVIAAADLSSRGP